MGTLRRRVLGRTEVSPERRRSVEETKKARAHDADPHLARRVADTNGQIPLGKTSGTFEGRRPFRQVNVARVLTSKRRALLAAECLKTVDAVSGGGILQQRRRSKEQPIDEREHRRVGAD